MTVHLSPEAEAILKEMVEIGDHSSPEAAIEFLLEGYLEDREKLRRLIQEGLDSGPSEPFDMEEVKQAAREEFQRRQSGA